MARPRPRSARRVPRVRFPLRTRFSRTAVLYWSAVVTVAVATAMTVSALVDRAAEAESRFGRTRTVVVARRSLAPGDAIDAADVTVVRWPERLVPEGAMTDLSGNRVVSADIVAGEPVVRGRLSGPDAAGAAGLVPPGHRALALPVLIEGLPARPGDLVDVYVSPGGGDPGDLPVDAGAAPSPVGGAVRVSENALVIAVADRSITVAVPSADAPVVAAGIPGGTVIVALAGPPG